MPGRSAATSNEPGATGPRHPWGRISRRALRRLGAQDALPIDPELATDDPGAPGVEHSAVAVGVHRAHPRTLAAIAVGGFLGTLGRYELTTAWPGVAGGFPWSVFVINTSGALLIGLVLTVILERGSANPYLRPFAAVGVLGGWTTMSTLAVDSDILLKDGHVTTAVAYMVATVVAGVGAAAIGIALARVRRTPAVEGGPQ